MWTPRKQHTIMILVCTIRHQTHAAQAAAATSFDAWRPMQLHLVQCAAASLPIFGPHIDAKGCDKTVMPLHAGKTHRQSQCRQGARQGQP